MKGWQEQVHALRLGTRPRGSGGASLTTEAATRIAKAGLTSCCSPRIALVQPGALETHGGRDREAARGLEDVAEFLGLARIGQDWFGFIEEVVDVELDFEGAGFLQAPLIGEHGVGERIGGAVNDRVVPGGVETDDALAAVVGPAANGEATHEPLAGPERIGSEKIPRVFAQLPPRGTGAGGDGAIDCVHSRSAVSTVAGPPVTGSGFGMPVAISLPSGRVEFCIHTARLLSRYAPLRG